MTSISASPVPHLQTIWEWDTLIKNIYIPAQPKTILEIGSFYGGTLWTFLVNNPTLTKLISIDLPIGPEDGRYQEMLRSRKKWEDWSNRIVSIVGNSHSPETVYKLSELTDTIDFLFIDGDHSYEGVKKDFELYSPFVKKGGYIVLHDSVGYDSVAKFCSELKSQENSKFIEINQKNGWGLFVYEK